MPILHRSLFLHVFLAGVAVAAASAQTSLPKEAWVFRCTAGSVSYGVEFHKVANPIAFALSRAGPGSTIVLAAGTYPPFSIGANTRSPHDGSTSGGQRGRPIVIEGNGRATIHARGGADTIFVSQRQKNGYIHFRNLTIVPGYRAGVMFAIGGVHEGFEFTDCNIRGSWNHVERKGHPSKWGVWGRGLKEFVFRGRRDYAEVRNIRDEHGFYLQNLQGDVTIEKVRGMALGRTFFQLTARKGDGPVGTGNVTLRDCFVADVCIAPGDAYKGGSAITIGGRHNGVIRVEGCTVRAGFNEAFLPLRLPGQPYGTGALVVVDGGESPPNGTLIIEDSTFEFAEGCGDRPLASIGGCRQVSIRGECRFASGSPFSALALDPMRDPLGLALVSRANGKVTIDSRTRFVGKVEIRGEVASPEAIAELGR